MCHSVCRRWNSYKDCANPFFIFPLEVVANFRIHPPEKTTYLMRKWTAIDDLSSRVSHPYHKEFIIPLFKSCQWRKDQVTISHIPRQLRCRGMCETITWTICQNLNLCQIEWPHQPFMTWIPSLNKFSWMWMSWAQFPHCWLLMRRSRRWTGQMDFSHSGSIM